MDNLSVHTSGWVRELIEERGCQLWLLPSYSPEMNPIEEAFSKVNGLLRKAKARTLDALFEVTAGALSAVSASDARGYFRGLWLQDASGPLFMKTALDQQVCQLTQRSVDGVVDPLSAGVGRDLGGQARQQPSQRLGAVALQSEEVLELADDPFYDLALAGGPAPIGLRPSPAGVVLGRRRDERPVSLHPKPLPFHPGEALVGQE